MTAGVLEQAVDLFDAGIALEVDGQVDQRHVDHRYPYRHAGEFSSQLRQHQADSFGRACLARNHRLGGRAGAERVAVVDVSQALVIGVGVDGGH
ncbi:hypothetical protein D3C76_1482100 [compost metagenome]